ncbi:LSU ribosomal protein L13P [Cruoricaptor ignavus]|uniref:Large ribosomal subunit protein uL13 n=1 Tax=Cruoricaptor ignavus TaxID=1118202 RepID=A0A1M6CWN4_9FLAO|nr:LSU ribosomal protein L13P [Cruoricaptor ignavus]
MGEECLIYNLVSVNTLSYKTISANKATANKEWVVVDAEGQPLGRLASTVARILRGKHKANFTPHVDCGDNVIVLNAGKVTLSGNKWEDKTYIWHTGHPGGQRFRTAQEQLKKDPLKILERSVKGMLPKNRLGAAILKNLYLYEGAEHKHEAQQPKTININEFK